MSGESEVGVQLLKVPELFWVGVRASVDGVGRLVVAKVPGHRNWSQMCRQRQVGGVNGVELGRDLGLSGDVLHEDLSILGRPGTGALEVLDLGEKFGKRVSGRAARQVIGHADPVSVLLQDPDLQLFLVVSR